MIDAKQLILTNGNQIICEVVDWPAEDDEDRSILIRNSIQILTFEKSLGPEGRIYAFRPWMAFQDEEGCIQTLSLDQVVSVAEPCLDVINMYMMEVYNMHVISQNRKEVIREYEESLNSRKIEEIFANLQDQRLNKRMPDDSDRSNVVSLFPNDPNKVH